MESDCDAAGQTARRAEQEEEEEEEELRTARGRGPQPSRPPSPPPPARGRYATILSITRQLSLQLSVRSAGHGCILLDSTKFRAVHVLNLNTCKFKFINLVVAAGIVGWDTAAHAGGIIPKFR
eukprot:SAG31_NODE_2235_length_6123_cov_2.723274_1_plen_123_part_00